MKLLFNLKILNNTLKVLLSVGACWSVYLAIYYITNSQLVYIDRKEGGKMDISLISTGGRGGFSLRRLTFLQVHDAEKGQVIEKKVECTYDWAPVIGIQRRIFLHRNKLKQANRVYFYLCKSRNVENFEKCFAFTAGEQPLNLFFFSDIFRVSLQCYLLFFGLISILFDWFAKKYFGQKIIKNKLVDNIMPYLIVLFLIF